MFKRILQHIKRAVDTYNAECALAEDLEYRRALKAQMRQAPHELDACNLRIARTEAKLLLLRSGTIGSPQPARENDHAADTREVGQEPVGKHTPRAQGKQRP